MRYHEAGLRPGFRFSRPKKRKGRYRLAKVGDITSTLAKLLCFSQSRNGQGADQTDNDDGNKELDKGKSTLRSIGLVAGGWLSVVGW